VRHDVSEDTVAYFIFTYKPAKNVCDVMHPRILLHTLFVCVLYITLACIHVGLHYDILNEVFMLLLSLSPHSTYDVESKIIIYGVVENTRRLIMGRIIACTHAHKNHILVENRTLQNKP